MPNQVNVNTTTNQVTVTQGVTQIVTVTAQGPQGVKGAFNSCKPSAASNVCEKVALELIPTISNLAN